MAGDDVPSIRDYRPHVAGGPLHLINVTINQTVDFTSQRGNRDRKGENLAVSSHRHERSARLGMARWVDRSRRTATRAAEASAAIMPLGACAGHRPSVDRRDRHARPAAPRCCRCGSGWRFPARPLGPGRRARRTQLGTRAAVRPGEPAHRATGGTAASTRGRPRRIPAAQRSCARASYLLAGSCS